MMVSTANSIFPRLPFLSDPDVALGIAVKTYFDDVNVNASPGAKAEKMVEFPATYVPYASAFAEDLDIACNFFDAVYAGVKSLDPTAISPANRQGWDKAAQYLALRR